MRLPSAQLFIPKAAGAIWSTRTLIPQPRKAQCIVVVGHVVIVVFHIHIVFVVVAAVVVVVVVVVSRCNTSGTLPWYSLAAVTCTSTLRVWLKTLGLKRTSLSASQTSGLSSVCVDF